MQQTLSLGGPCVSLPGLGMYPAGQVKVWLPGSFGAVSVHVGGPGMNLGCALTEAAQTWQNRSAATHQ
jgi:hypothetical protein